MSSTITAISHFDFLHNSNRTRSHSHSHDRFALSPFARFQIIAAVVTALISAEASRLKTELSIHFHSKTMEAIPIRTLVEFLIGSDERAIAAVKTIAGAISITSCYSRRSDAAMKRVFLG